MKAENKILQATRDDERGAIIQMDAMQMLIITLDVEMHFISNYLCKVATIGDQDEEAVTSCFCCRRQRRCSVCGGNGGAAPVSERQREGTDSCELTGTAT